MHWSCTIAAASVGVEGMRFLAVILHLGHCTVNINLLPDVNHITPDVEALGGKTRFVAVSDLFLGMD